MSCESSNASQIKYKLFRITFLLVRLYVGCVMIPNEIVEGRVLISNEIISY